MIGKVIWASLVLIISVLFLLHAARGFDITAVYYIQSDVINVRDNINSYFNNGKI